MTTRILLADDHEIILDGVHAMLQAEPEFEVIARATDCKRAIQLSRELVPDLVVLDITMPDMSGIEATRLIVSEQPAVRVLCLSMHADRGFVMAALEAGVSGYVLKDTARQELLHAIHSAIKGQVYLSPGVAGMVVEVARSRISAVSNCSGFDLLSARETAVLELIAQGESTRQIACRLHLSVKTIGTHRRNIMEKLKIKSIAGLTKFAIREGLASGED
jgi:DNA-binding NarL/FixJ family response regulator